MSEKLRRYSPQVLAALALFAISLGIGYFTKGEATVSREALPSDTAATTRGAVQSLSGDTLLILTDAGPREFTLVADGPVEKLAPVDISAVKAGDWLNAGALPNAQTMFSLVGLTLIPQALLQDP